MIYNYQTEWCSLKDFRGYRNPLEFLIISGWWCKPKSSIRNQVKFKSDQNIIKIRSNKLEDQKIQS